MRAAYVGADLKQAVQAACGVLVASQRLVFDGALLEDAATLDRMPDGSQVFLVVAADAGSVLPVVEAVPDPESEVCSICLEEYTPTFAPVTLRCHHAFHDECIKVWRAHSPFCPLCRQEIAFLTAEPAAAASSAAASGASASSGKSFAPLSVEEAKAALLATRDSIKKSQWFKNVSAAVNEARHSEAARIATSTVKAGVRAGVSLAGKFFSGVARYVEAEVSKAIHGPTAASSPAGAPPVLPSPPPPPKNVYRCPRCSALLRAPDGVPVFRCGCGSILRAQVTFHV